MIEKYRIFTEPNTNELTPHKLGLTCIHIYARDDVGQIWIDELVDELAEKFGYKLTGSINGPCGELLRDMENGDKKILVKNDVFDDAEIQCENKAAEEDIEKIRAHMADILVS